MTDETRVTRNDETSRYEIHVGDTVGGFAAFVTSRSGRVLMTHTEIDPQFKGRGLGSILAGEALADLATRGETVVPRCPFIAHYLRGNEVTGLIVDWPADDDAPAEQPS
ncbi:GNAT family N-acetyltransferase [Microbacterium sp. P06]|uniref:GNAT family N-acetyltransferase n=1 Tax=unclassified Microbacterium TaxID=2609290 RepID=UPI00374706EC